MRRFRVLLTDHAWPHADMERELLAAGDAELIVAREMYPASLAILAADVNAILTCWAAVPAAVILAAKRCRIISRMGIGLDNIDIAAATRQGIVVTNVPDYCLAEVAEHTLALIFALARNVAFFHRETFAGRYDRSLAAPMHRLAGRTLGLIGCGAIGRQVATRAAALGLKVIATTRRRESLGNAVAWVDLPTLLAESDFVSLHLPLSEGTRHVINADALRQMKPSAFLINTSRGGLIDHTALAAALAEDRLAGAALDVQDPEPPVLSVSPYNHSRVIVTPHVAFLSEESLRELRTRACAQVLACLHGQRPENVVNPDVDFL